MDGRVKTLHPAVFGGILADTSNPQHVADLEAHDIGAFGLVVCNLYDFEANPGVENIDIGGPSMLRAAAKNFASTAVVVDPDDYDWVLAELMEPGDGAGQLCESSRLRLATKVFEVTQRYDRKILEWMEGQAGGGADSEQSDDRSTDDSPSDDPPSKLPATINLTASLALPLRYGENPAQQGGLYYLDSQPSWFADAQLLNGSTEAGGKGLSYLNLLDMEAAWHLACDLDESSINKSNSYHSAVIVKHTNPCGAAMGKDLTQAWQKSYSCDPVSAFGGVVALSSTVTPELARLLTDIFLEVMVAPDYEPQALELLAQKKNLRVVAAPRRRQPQLNLKSALGGLLVQTPPAPTQSTFDWTISGKYGLHPAEDYDVEFAWTVVAATQSNAIVIAHNLQAIGIGAGQQNRKNAVELAVRQAREHSPDLLEYSTCASDAFFPFRDGVDLAAEAGCRVVVQPGGSVRDDEVIEAADEHKMVMVMTGDRCFRH